MRSFYTIAALFLSFISFAQSVKSPKEFLGYELGEYFTRHHQVVDYFRHVANNSNMVQVEEYGKTNEHRLLQVAYVSSSKNLNNLETIRKSHLSNAGIGNENSVNNIAVVWLSYNVHGNESSSTEASMNTIYKLITEKKDWLENTVVIIDPCMNPDGRDRYVNWYNQVKSTPYNNAQVAKEHSEPWPGGRPNHYLFDLNRDWAWATQVETQQRLKIYNKWLPHIHVDFHEQGINEPYYFAPAAEPFHEVITNWQRNFQTQIGKNHAKYFDKNGWLYFTRERFDLLYPSYGDTYPTFVGAIGMTYEQAGHGRAGLGIMTDEGDELTLKDRIVHHTTTGLSTIEISSQNASQLVEEYKKYYGPDKYNYRSYVLQGDNDKINTLKDLLDRHDITYTQAPRKRVFGYQYSENGFGSVNSSNKDLVVSVNQPKGKLVKVLFEPKAKLSDSLTYDITAWSIPYAYGLNAIASNSLISGTTVNAKEATSNKIDTEAIAYAAKWNHIKDAAFLGALLQKNVRVRFTEKPFQSNGKIYDRGTLIITRGDNKNIENFDALVASIADAHNRELSVLKSGFATTGVDVGSPDVKEIKNQKIAVLSGEGTSSLSFGEIWYFFEQELKYPVTNINTSSFNSSTLNKFHVLVIPNGYYYSLLKDYQLEAIKKWARKGGKVIAIGNALEAFADKDGFGLTKKKVKEDNKDDTTVQLTSYREKERQGVSELITGAIFKTKVDNTHPLAFGYDDTYFTLKLGSNKYHYLKNGYNVVYNKKTEVVSGFAGKKALKGMDKTLILGEQPMGNGSIIYMVDNPLFRAFWQNGKLFFANAIFMSNVNLFEL
jgi:hypothetical protein